MSCRRRYVRSCVATRRKILGQVPESGRLVFHKDLEANLMVIPGSGYHMPVGAKARLSSLFDDGDYEELIPPETPTDPLRFRDIKRYVDRLKENRAKAGAADAVTVAFGNSSGRTSPSRCRTLPFRAERSAWRPGKRSSPASSPPSSDGRRS